MKPIEDYSRGFRLYDVLAWLCPGIYNIGLSRETRSPSSKHYLLEQQYIVAKIWNFTWAVLYTIKGECTCMQLNGIGHQRLQ